MNRKALLSAAIISMSFLAANVLSQSPRQILKAATKALGGTKKLKAIRSWKKSGLIIRTKDGVSGEYSSTASKPNLYNSKFDLRGFETESGFNGKSGWLRDSREGLRTLAGTAGDNFKAEVVYRNWGWIDYKKRKEKLASGGKSVVFGRPANVVILTNVKGVPIRLFFDAATNYLVREEIRSGETVRTFDYSDYRPVNGVKEPFQITTKLGDDTFAVKLDRIIHNAPVSQSTFDFPRVLGDPLPDIPGLLKELQANEDTVENILENYSYTEKTTKRKLGNDGILRNVSSKTYQLSFLRGYRVRRLISKNGIPLSSGQQKKEDKQVEKRVEKIEKTIKKQNRKVVNQAVTGTPEKNGRRISIAEVLRASKLLNPRREVLQERNVIVFDFEPDPDFDFKKAKSFLKFFGKTAGVIWIDEEDKQVARLEAVLFDSYKVGGGILAELRKGASFTLENQRFNNEIWLPQTVDINLSIRVLLVGGVKVNQLIESSDYRRFETEVENARVKAPKRTGN
jgi:hypothetical protein